MSHRNDSRMTRLALSGYLLGTGDDRVNDWLRDATGWAPGEPETTNDLWMRFLDLQGAAGEQLNDKFRSFLQDQTGTEGALNDLWATFWSTDAPLPGAPITSPTAA